MIGAIPLRTALWKMRDSKVVHRIVKPEPLFDAQGRFGTGRLSATRRGRQLFERHPAWSAGGLTAAVVFFVLFRTGMFVASGDVAPLITDGLQKELGWQWTHQTTGAGGPTYEIARAIEVLFVQIARFLGGTEALGQRLLFATIWGATAAAGASLAARFTSRGGLSIVLGLVTVFNPYVLIAQPNPLPFVAIGVAAAMTAICVDAARDGKRGKRSKFRWIRFAALTLPCSYLSLNPPLLALVLAFAALQPILVPTIAGTGLGGFRRVSGLLVRAAPLGAALSAWWAVPAFIAIRYADPTAMGAVTNIEAWSWTHRRSSVANVFTMFGHWSWPRSEYYGESIAIEKFPWVLLRWVLPIGAIVAPLVVRRVRRVPAVLVSSLIAVSVFVGKGVHQPMANVNRWFYVHVPGFWLFREPAAKVGVVLIVLYVIGFAMMADELANRWAVRSASPRLVHQRLVSFHPQSSLGKRVTQIIALAMGLGPIVGVWPMWTGAIVKSSTFAGTSDRISLPSSWHRVARFINGSPLEGKTLVLPVDDYYQVPTTWGYYGADNLVRRLVKRPVIQSDPQLYVGDSDVFEALMRTVEQSIVNDNGQGTDTLLQALGVSHVVVRKDIDFASPKRKVGMQRPEPILAGLQHVQGLRPMLSTDVADVFERTRDTGKPVEVLGGIVQVGSLPPEGMALLRGAIPPGLALSSKTKIPSLVAGRALVRHGSDSTDADFGSPEIWSASRHYASSPTLRVRVGDGRLFGENPVDWQVNGRSQFPLTTVDYKLPGLAGVEVGTGYYDRWSDPPIVQADSATDVTPWIATDRTPGATNLGLRSKVLDCNNRDGLGVSALGFGATHLTDLFGSGIELRAKYHSACVRFTIQDATPGATFHVRVTGRSVSGGNPRLCIWMKGPNKCAAIVEKVDGRSRETVGIWTVPAGVSAADLYLYADGNGIDTETVTRYGPLSIVRVARGASLRLPRPATSAVAVKTAAGTQPLRAVFRAATEPDVGKFGFVGDCNRADDRTPLQVGLSAEPLSGGFRLRARAHSACVSAPIERLLPGLPYVVSFEHRTLAGEKARYCVLEKLSGKCLASGYLDSSNGEWAKAQVKIKAAPTDAKDSLRLYLYADGTYAGTAVEYRQVSIAPYIDEFIALLSAGTKSRVAPAMTFHKISPARYRVRVDGATAPFVLALSDSWSADWKVSGAAAGTKIDHLRIDGYRNGWAIDARGDLDLLVEYVPARAGQLAISVSLATSILVILGLIGVQFARRRSIVLPRGLLARGGLW
jgi:arabinofuranan 3-O-arabinosyltransferase